MRRWIQKVLLLDLLRGLRVTFRQQMPALISTEQYPADRPDQYTIGIGDQIAVAVFNNDRMSTTTTVRSDGKISVPLLSDVDAAGKAPAVLAADIEKKLKDAQLVLEPHVTVTVGHERLGLMPVEALQLSRSVRFADLDLTTRAGATALQNRILDTATTICNKLMDVNPPGSAHQALQEKTTCVNDAVDGAMTKARQVISSARAR